MLFQIRRHWRADNPDPRDQGERIDALRVALSRASLLDCFKEAVELPLTHPEYYEEMGIKPPKGVILYGEPGTGKTLLAKAVANQTSATFLRVVGSELIQKYLVMPLE